MNTVPATFERKTNNQFEIANKLDENQINLSVTKNINKRDNAIVCKKKIYREVRKEQRIRLNDEDVMLPFKTLNELNYKKRRESKTIDWLRQRVGPHNVRKKLPEINKSHFILENYFCDSLEILLPSHICSAQFHRLKKSGKPESPRTTYNLKTKHLEWKLEIIPPLIKTVEAPKIEENKTETCSKPKKKKKKSGPKSRRKKTNKTQVLPDSVVPVSEEPENTEDLMKSVSEESESIIEAQEENYKYSNNVIMCAIRGDWGLTELEINYVTFILNREWRMALKLSEIPFFEVRLHPKNYLEINCSNSYSCLWLYNVHSRISHLYDNFLIISENAVQFDDTAN